MSVARGELRPNSGERTGGERRGALRRPWRRREHTPSVPPTQTSQDALTAVREAIAHEAQPQQTEATYARGHEHQAQTALTELGFDYDHEPTDLLQAIHEAEAIADKFGFRMIIVGGAALTRHIDGQPDVHLTSVDTQTKTITIEGARNPGLVREEDGTTTDIDTILVRKEGLNPFDEQTREDYEALQEALELHVAQRKSKTGEDGQPLRTPSIAAEPVYYHPPFPEMGPIKKLINFNSRIDVYQDEHGQERWFTTLGPVQTEFDPEILQTWRVRFADRPDDPGIPTLMVPAYRQRFFMRGIAIKEKDKKKTEEGSALWNLQQEFFAGLKPQEQAHYQQIMAPWLDFTQQLQENTLLSLQRPFWNWYWNTIGDELAHEKGLVGEIVQPLKGVTRGEIGFGEATQQMWRVIQHHSPEIWEKVLQILGLE